MSDAPSGSKKVRRRQLMLLGGGLFVIAALTLVGVGFFDDSDKAKKVASGGEGKPMSNVPGAAIDPKDAWRGRADTHLSTLEARLAELEKNMATGGKPMGMAGQIPAGEPKMPPDLQAVLNAAEAKANTGRAGQAPQAEQQPKQPAQAARNLPPDPPPPKSLKEAPPFPEASQQRPAGIDKVVFSDKAGTNQRAAAAGAKPEPKTPKAYIPSGAFSKVQLLNGFDAPTGGQAQNNPIPVLMQVLDYANLPNRFRQDIKECRIIGAAHGDLSSERAMIRTETLSCVRRDGKVLEVAMRGQIAGMDGKMGIRGRLVSKQGQVLANALLSGIFSGLGRTFTSSSTTTSTSPLGSTSTVEPGKEFQYGFGQGVGNAMDKLADYYIRAAEKIFPVVEVDAGNTGEVVVTKGFELDLPADGGHGEDVVNFSALGERNKEVSRHAIR